MLLVLDQIQREETAFAGGVMHRFGQAFGMTTGLALALLLSCASALLAGALLGALATALFIVLAAPWVQMRYGVNLKLSAPSAAQGGLFAAVVLAGGVASLIPAWRAYRLSLADGLSPRV